MFLVYVDESGEIANPTEKFFVLGAMAVYETQAYFLSQAFDKVQDKWFPSALDPIEFHASKIYNGDGEPWHSVKRSDRNQILTDLFHEIGRVTPKGLSLFGIALEKNAYSSPNQLESAFQELCGHVDAFISASNLSSSNEGRDKNRILMILDSSKYHGHLDKLLLAYRLRGGTKFGRVRCFADAPTFANSSTTRLLQAADLVSWAVYRRYERSDTFFLDKILSRFQEKDGKIHGLMHLANDWRNCSCQACISRK